MKTVIFDMYETLITHYESPLYFSAQMAEDAGIDLKRFQELWQPTEYDRTIGNLTLEDVITNILTANHCFSESLLNKIVEKRTAAKIECFKHLHSEIIPMLEALKDHHIGIGLISNCFSEEAKVIRKSELFPYFDAFYLSYEQGIAKPDEEIFYRCMNHFPVKASECIYVGDGGSYELETAKKLGMKALQATWYLKEGTLHIIQKNPNFQQLEKPLNLINLLDNYRD